MGRTAVLLVAVVAVVVLAIADVGTRRELSDARSAADASTAAASEAEAARAEASSRLAALSDDVAAAAQDAEAAAGDLAAARTARDGAESDLAATALQLDDLRAAFTAELTAGTTVEVVAALGRCLRGVRQALVAVSVDDWPSASDTLERASTDCSAAESLALGP